MLRIVVLVEGEYEERVTVASIGSVYPLPYFALQNSLLGSVPNPQNGKESKTNGRQKTNRAGQILCDGRRTEVDSRKMKLIPTRNMAAYLRKMAIDGYVVHIDTTDIRVQTAELQKIGVNVNQIARRLNSMGPLYTQDVADIKGALAQIWQLQRYILSSQR